MLIKLLGINGEGHGSDIFLDHLAVIVVLRVVWILQVEVVWYLVEVFGLTSASVLEFVWRTVAIEVVVHEGLPLLHGWAISNLDVIDSVSDARLLHDIPGHVWVRSHWLSLSECLWLTPFKHSVLSLFLFSCFLHSLELFLLVDLLALSSSHLSSRFALLVV